MSVDRSDRKQWAGEHFRGLENVLMPSFSADLSELDEEAIRLDVRQSVRHGFFSTLCSVESGLSLEEKKRFIVVAADEAGGDISVGFSLTGDSLEENVELLGAAETAGASHALVSFPQSFVARSQDDVYEFVAALSESTNLGIYLFISDKFGFGHLHPSGVPFEAYDRAADLPNVIAMKVGGMDAGMIFECFERFGDRLLVGSVNLGLQPLLVEIYGARWSGAWTVEALQSPEKPYAVDFFSHLLEGRPDEAMEIYWRLSPALGVMMRLMAPLVMTGTYHWPQLKYFQYLTGGNGGFTRSPVMRLYDRDMQAIRMGYRAIGIEPQGSDEDFFLGRTVSERRATAVGS